MQYIGISCSILGFHFRYFLFQISTGVYERLVFEVASGKQITSSDVINKITWASWTRLVWNCVCKVSSTCVKEKIWKSSSFQIQSTISSYTIS